MADWTIIKVLSWTDTYFKDSGVDSPRLTAEILLAHSLGVRRLDLYLQHDRPLEKKELSDFKSLIRRRVAHEPVAYITGEKGFFDSNFQVREGVLIPRPDTEVLVEKAIELMGGGCAGCGQGAPRKILELGVGSGAIIISLARACPGHDYFACDLSSAAISTARANAEQILNSPVHFFQGSWLEAVALDSGFDLILSNPPYIPNADIEGLAPEIANFEPRLALDGGGDGLEAIRRIVCDAKGVLNPGGCLLIEMGFDQAPGVADIAREHPEYVKVEFIKDLAGHDRLVFLEKIN